MPNSGFLQVYQQEMLRGESPGAEVALEELFSQVNFLVCPDLLSLEEGFGADAALERKFVFVDTQVNHQFTF